MKLNALIFRVSSPLHLQGAVIAGEILREFEFLALQGRLFTPACERPLLIGAAIQGIYGDEFVLIGARA